MSQRAINVGRKPTSSTTESFIVNTLHDSYELHGRPHLYGSGAAYCPRQNYLNSFAYEKMATFTPASQLYMSIGVGIENAIVDGLKRKNRLFFTNLYLPPMVPKVAGKIDLVYLDQDDQISIGELKSCGNLPTLPKPAHQAQLLTYAAVGGYKRANLIYISRSVADNKGQVLIRAFEMNLSQEVLTSTLERIVWSQTSIEEGWLPDIPIEFRKTDCAYCQFANYCWKGQPLTIAEPDALVGLDPVTRDAKKVEAQQRAEQLFLESDDRYVASLRHIWRNITDPNLKRNLIAEIESTGQKF